MIAAGWDPSMLARLLHALEPGRRRTIRIRVPTGPHVPYPIGLWAPVWVMRS